MPVDGHELVFVYPQALLIAELRRRDIQYHTEVQVAGAVALPATVVGRLIGNTIATVLFVHAALALGTWIEVRKRWAVDA